jgi:REP element-mobilizing transposase RayT
MERFYTRHVPHYRIDSDGTVYFVPWHLALTQCVLSGNERDVVAEALRFWDGRNCELLAFVVIDNHVHLLVVPTAPTRLEQLLHSWKSFTAHRLVGEYRRTPPIWVQESYDRVVRNDREFEESIRYILENPQKRWPEQVDYRWVWPKDVG